MLFHVSMTHSPDNCWARAENEAKADAVLEDFDDRAADAGVRVHASHVTPNEHTFFFLLEADSFAGVSAFLGPPILQDHDADVTPVLTFGEVDAMLAE